MKPKPVKREAPPPAFVAKIPCDTQDQKEAIERAMRDDTVRTTVLVSGYLAELDDDASRRRVLTYIADRFGVRLG